MKGMFGHRREHMADRIRVRAREGEEVEWSHKAARYAGALKDMMDDCPPENGIYPVPTIAAAALSKLAAMSEPDASPASLSHCSIMELLELIEGAIFLDACAALELIKTAVASRLNGKRAEELRGLLGANDFGSDEECAAALAEPTFTPDEPLQSATLPPALPTFTDDAKEAALGMVDVATLAEIKGVNRSWCALARRVLCTRLCRREGQPVPAMLANITDLDVGLLAGAGRLWEAAAAGRDLPGLVRLHGDGFEVDVVAVRGVHLDPADEDHEEGADEEDEESDSIFCGAVKAALRSCITGIGEPPLDLMLAAVACAGSGEIQGIPVQAMRSSGLTQLNLVGLGPGEWIGPHGAMLVACLLPVMASLTRLVLKDNNLGPQGAQHLSEGLTVNKSVTELDISNVGGSSSGDIQAEGAKYVADMLRVNASLTSLDVGDNGINGDEAKQLAAAVLAKPTIEVFTSIPLKELRMDSLTTLDLTSKGLGIPEAIVLADLLQFVSTSLTTVHRLQPTNPPGPLCNH